MYVQVMFILTSFHGAWHIFDLYIKIIFFYYFHFFSDRLTLKVSKHMHAPKTLICLAIVINVALQQVLIRVE